MNNLSSTQNPITFCAQYIAENPLLLPLEELKLVAQKNEVLSDIEKTTLKEAHLFALCKSSETDPNQEEILYICECFGANGEGDIFKRLLSDPQLIEIIERAKENWPQGIFSILMLPFSHEPYLLPAEGIADEDLEKDPLIRKKIEKIQRLQVPLRRKNDMLEAALIGYFQPIYNQEYPKKFSSSLGKLLEKFAQANISAILIEFSTEQLEIKFFSSTQTAEKQVLLPFDISSKLKRNAFISLNSEPNA
ncbi:hypothetical protein FAI40_06895 [Acetobacteraceae bacterium]|nr:hypothetical protein FAI40_06895 [Acetobacteraceae bacterium]